jgi:hypothetical protein
MIFTVFSEQLADMPQPRLAETIEKLLQKAAAEPAARSQTPVRHAIVNKRQARHEEHQEKGK